ncbi:MAG: hypothetical protein A2908_02860 [Candidatus Staskawiczbacteria bacterium RIFCSPLOWO2_01_FULL_38_12b]|uniref:Uncharacterized protein n=1 Tax=Candidatus Staskawiczbacteria bacterium RIFCSPLOWO2_01_FULL_38_12b TaxID=1802214 RepID=A0A1G2IDC1_9BACT|nr:MAG: hypothetical protein A2908_02860 [Candidatus Staskawiczbacteria bacterium RIFCSPLOWO2_01_FULL_38_12b]
MTSESGSGLPDSEQSISPIESVEPGEQEELFAVDQLIKLAEEIRERAVVLNKSMEQDQLAAFNELIKLAKDIKEKIDAPNKSMEQDQLAVFNELIKLAKDIKEKIDVRDESMGEELLVSLDRLIDLVGDVRVGLEVVKKAKLGETGKEAGEDELVGPEKKNLVDTLKGYENESERKKFLSKLAGRRVYHFITQEDGTRVKQYLELKRKEGNNLVFWAYNLDNLSEPIEENGKPKEIKSRIRGIQYRDWKESEPTEEEIKNPLVYRDDNENFSSNDVEEVIDDEENRVLKLRNRAEISTGEPRELRSDELVKYEYFDEKGNKKFAYASRTLARPKSLKSAKHPTGPEPSNAELEVGIETPAPKTTESEGVPRVDVTPLPEATKTSTLEDIEVSERRKKDKEEIDKVRSEIEEDLISSESEIDRKFVDAMAGEGTEDDLTEPKSSEIPDLSPDSTAEIDENEELKILKEVFHDTLYSAMRKCRDCIRTLEGRNERVFIGDVEVEEKLVRSLKENPPVEAKNLEESLKKKLLILEKENRPGKNHNERFYRENRISLDEFMRDCDERMLNVMEVVESSAESKETKEDGEEESWFTKTWKAPLRGFDNAWKWTEESIEKYGIKPLNEAIEKNPKKYFRIGMAAGLAGLAAPFGLPLLPVFIILPVMFGGFFTGSYLMVKANTKKNEIEPEDGEKPSEDLPQADLLAGVSDEEVKTEAENLPTLDLKEKVGGSGVETLPSNKKESAKVKKERLLKEKLKRLKEIDERYNLYSDEEKHNEVTAGLREERQEIVEDIGEENIKLYEVIKKIENRKFDCPKCKYRTGLANIMGEGMCPSCESTAILRDTKFEEAKKELEVLREKLKEGSKKTKK